MKRSEWMAWARALPVQALIENKDAISRLHPKIREEFEGLDDVKMILHQEWLRRFKKTEEDDYEE